MPPAPPGAGAPSPRLGPAKLAAARVFAASRYPYLASALFAVPLLPVAGTGTIAVDRRWRILADPDVVDSMEAQELGRLVVHLVSHLLRDHAARAVAAGVTAAEAREAGGCATADGGEPGGAPAYEGAREAGTPAGEGGHDPAGRTGLSGAAGDGRADAWARAADAEVNDDLVTAAMVPTCAPDLPGTWGAKDGQLAETYYRRLGQGRRHWDCGSGCDGLPRSWDPDACRGDHDGNCDARCQGTNQRQAEWLRQGVASELQRMGGLEPGSVPAGWARWAEQVLPSKVDWRKVLAAEVRWGVERAAGMVDYSYRRPSRRGEAAPQVIFPVLEQPVPEVAVVCDTSGSMTDGQLAQALAEVEALLQRAGVAGRQVRVLACDAAVHTVKRVSRASQVELAGGGGTDMAEGIAQALALRPRPSVVVVLTDGFTPWPAEPVRGARVVVALIGPPDGPVRGHRRPEPPSPPAWARTVRLDVPVG